MSNLPGYGDEATWGGRSPEEPDTDPRIEELAAEIAEHLFDGTESYQLEGRTIDQVVCIAESCQRITPEQHRAVMGNSDTLASLYAVALHNRCRHWAAEIAAAQIREWDEIAEMDAALDRAEARQA